MHHKHGKKNHADDYDSNDSHTGKKKAKKAQAESESDDEKEATKE